MKKFYLFLVVALTGFSSLFAQERKACGTDEANRKALLDHPEFLQQQQELEEFTQNYIQNHQSQSRVGGPTYIIPVVFHIIHNYGGENISDAQVLDAMRVINEDYNAQNDTSVVIPEFKPLVANCGFEFRLATIDPNGNCTNGIDRIASFLTDIGTDTAKFNPWPQNKYLNIWVVNKMGASHDGAAAYAYAPGASPTTLRGSADGVIALASYVGSIGVSSPDHAFTLPHEIGHCLNLRHTWGATNQPGVNCTGDDLVGDTPPTQGSSPVGTCNLGLSICNPPVIENVQNYMDYSYCNAMFTLGQKARMVACLNSSVGGRNNLWTTANLIATGTDGSPVQVCAPRADFYPLREHICSGDSVTFVATCFNTDTITSYLWSFPGGSPSSSTLQNPSVMYGAPGPYNVSLTATNQYGSGSITKDTVFYVSEGPAFTPPYFNDFESSTNFPGPGGYVVNDSGFTWQRITTVGYSGTACLKMPNYNTHQSEYVDSWITPSINMTGYGATQFTFRMAYARFNNNKSDKLTISISIDCGKTWTIRKTLAGSGLATTTNVLNFVPSSTSQWALETVSLLSAFWGKPDVRFKFEFTSDGDNNLYIDDINITATPTGIEEPGASPLSFEIFPNPSNDVFNVSFDLLKSEKTEVKITDMIGREIKTVVEDFLSAGEHEYVVPARDLSKGIYLVTLKAGESTTVKRLMIQ